MRIISGTHKSKRITAPKNLPVRPTTDMAKEALFNIINNRFYFEDINVLDLFAGTGNIAFEFASRGCSEIICVDAHYACVKFIEATAKSLAFNISTVKSDVFKYLERVPVKMDLIFADPPYDMSPALFAQIPELVYKNNLLQPDGVLIIEHSKHLKLSDLKHFSEQRSYGGSSFSFFENKKS